MLSIVIPMRNEAANIDPLFRRLQAVLEGLPMEWEVVCVNDGSTDATLAQLVAKHQADARIKVLDFSRNFGKEAAMTAGLEHSRGDAVVPMDADLQHPPELIPKLLDKWEQGFDVVIALRTDRPGESVVRRILSRLFYRLADFLFESQALAGAGDFRLMSRPVVNAVLLLRESNRYMKGIFGWVGFNQASVFYEQEARFAGVSSWGLWRLWRFAINAVTGFSTIPLKIWSYIGASIAVPSLIYAIYTVVKTLVYGVDLPGYSSLIVSVLFLGGVQLISLGVLGEYLARVHDEVKRRPLYLIKAKYGVQSSVCEYD